MTVAVFDGFNDLGGVLCSDHVPHGYTLAEITALPGDPSVLLNDFEVGDPADTELSAELITPPATGTLDFRADGSFIWTADGEGVETFTYRTMVWGDAIGAAQTVTLTNGDTGATYTLTLEPAAFALSGQDLALSYGRTLTLEPAAFTLTGQDISLSAARVLALEPASFVLTGRSINMGDTAVGPPTITTVTIPLIVLSNGFSLTTAGIPVLTAK